MKIFTIKVVYFCVPEQGLTVHFRDIAEETANPGCLKRNFYCALNKILPSVYLMVAIFLLMTASCASAATGKALPKWIKRPPQDTAQWIYGTGSGVTVEQARQDALADIAGKFQTGIKFANSNLAIKENGLATESFKRTFWVDVKNTELTNYGVVRTVPYGSGFFTLVRMSRPDFERNTRLRLDQLNLFIESQVRDAKRASKLRRFLAYRALLPQLRKARWLTLLLEWADPTFDGSRSLSLYQRYQERAATLAAGTRLMVQSSPELAPLAEAVADFLSQAGFITTSNPPADGTVLIRGSIERREIFSTDTVLLSVTIETKAPNGEVLKRHAYRLSGSSVINYQLAIQHAVTKLGHRNGRAVLSNIGLE